MLRKRWVQVAIAYPAAFVIAFLMTFFPNQKEVPLERPDRVVFNDNLAALSETVPLTGAAASALHGWVDPIRCNIIQQRSLTIDIPGSFRRGRYFYREGASYALQYTGVKAHDALLGVYFVSETEMPGPWHAITEGILGWDGLNFPHWGLAVFFRTQDTPCGKASRGARS